MLRLIERYPGTKLKLDPTNQWTPELVEQLVATGAVDSLDLKGQYKGTPVDVETDPELYRMVIEAFPNAWLEDPDVKDETKPLLDAVSERITWDAPIHSVADVLDRPWPPRMVNIKPSRFGPLSNLFEMYDWCEREGVRHTAAARPSSARAAATSSTSPRSSTQTPRTTRRPPATTSQSCPRGSPRAPSSRASRRPASAGCSDRGDPAPSGRRPAGDGAPDQRVPGRGHASLDLALYDVRLPGEPGDVVAAALREANERGVQVRIAYNADHPERLFFPPPPKTKPELLEAMPFPTCGIPGIPDLMHHKYVVRDAESVWTGSMNWTTDSWTLQENVVPWPRGAAELAAEFTQNFEELWTTRDVDASGHRQPRPLEVDGRRCAPGSRQATARSSRTGSPRRSEAGERVRIASPVITAGPVLGTLAEMAAEQRVDLRGVVDRTQMDQVVYQWRTNGHSAWKVPILASVLVNADFKGKPSTQWTPETPHDFMHAKVTVADDTVFAGSFNLSRSGEMNAENVLEVHDAELADQLAAFIDEVRERYEPMPVPDDVPPTSGGHAPPAARR